MQSSKSRNRFAWIVMGALTVGVFGQAAPVQAEDAAELVKQLTRKLSSVQRRIVTSPSRAEKEWIEARDILAQLKSSAPDHDKLPALEKRHTDAHQRVCPV